jgi:hypothetical protein
MALTKLTYCLRRKPGMTWEEFSDYWRNVHAPLVAKLADLVRRRVGGRLSERVSSRRS